MKIKFNFHTNIHNIAIQLSLPSFDNEHVFFSFYEFRNFSGNLQENSFFLLKVWIINPSFFYHHSTCWIYLSNITFCFKEILFFLWKKWTIIIIIIINSYMSVTFFYLIHDVVNVNVYVCLCELFLIIASSPLTRPMMMMMMMMRKWK